MGGFRHTSAGLVGQERHADPLPRAAPYVPEPFDSRLSIRQRATRWAREHRPLVALAILAAWAITLGFAFEAGHAYSEGVRSLSGFADHLGEMYEHYLGAARGLVGRAMVLLKYMWAAP